MHQAALLPAATLLSERERGGALSGLCMGVRGVGEGVVNVYLRVYICRSVTAHTPAIGPLINQVTFRLIYCGILLPYCTVWKKKS